MGDLIGTGIMLALSGGLKVFDAFSQRQAIAREQQMASQRTQLGLQQIKTATDVQDINAINSGITQSQAGLLKASVSGASVSSGAFGNVQNSIATNMDNNLFINQANETVENMNTLLSAQQNQQYLANKQSAVFPNLFGSLLGAGATMATDTFTGGTNASPISNTPITPARRRNPYSLFN